LHLRDGKTLETDSRIPVQGVHNIELRLAVSGSFMNVFSKPVIPKRRAAARYRAAKHSAARQ